MLPGIDFSGATPVNGWTLLIALLALGATIYTLIRNERLRPKPRWKLRGEWLEVPDGMRGAYRTHFFDLVNVGSGPALNVEIHLVTPPDMALGTTSFRPMDMNEDHRGRKGLVASGEHLRVPVGFLTIENAGNEVFPYARFVTKGVGFTVSYSYHPKVNKVRTAGPFMIDEHARQLPGG